MPFLKFQTAVLGIGFCRTTCMGSLFRSGPRVAFMNSKLSISLTWHDMAVLCEWDVDPTSQFNARFIFKNGMLQFIIF
jgi:hypothetical protein